ncbi:uncharacterized protein [Drosophila tropicalis]|uniref:uncharacterized protein n=1 Tax=Drosophila tropicalis TaxID=46794 RepID=UPI0035AB94CE
MTLSKHHPLVLLVALLLIVLAATHLIVAQEFLELEETPSAVSGPELSDPSDLSAGLNLGPVTNLIAAAANAVPPAPVQFVRNAMNSGL